MSVPRSSIFSTKNTNFGLICAALSMNNSVGIVSSSKRWGARPHGNTLIFALRIVWFTCKDGRPSLDLCAILRSNVHSDSVGTPYGGFPRVGDRRTSGAYPAHD